MALVVIDPHTDDIASLYAPLETYVGSVVPLMLQHARQLAYSKQTPLRNQLRQCQWLARLVSVDSRVVDDKSRCEVGLWMQLEERLCSLLEAVSDDDTGADAMNAAMALLRPHLKERYIADYRFPKRPFNCWWYTVHQQNTRLALHLINAYMPDSPFKHAAEFAADMLKATLHGIDEFPSVNSVECGSWLNEHGGFQQFWPASFMANRSIVCVDGGFGPGAWGQYMAADGSFVESNARYLLEHGRHRYPPNGKILPS